MVPGTHDHPNTPFSYYIPTSHKTAWQVLLLVPGYNGSGPAMLDERWCRLADECGLVLLAPTFTTTPEELKEEKGYYYPAQWSGQSVEEALALLHRRTGVRTDKILIFGFSAGAHFGHRFALWKPERVKALVSYSAAWWSEPTAALAHVPALIMCGEADERYAATRHFMDEAMRLHLPWIWRSYQGVGHLLTPAVRSMAEAFLRHYATNAKEEVRYGDIQSYRAVPAAEKESVPEDVRIPLPSKEVADVWEKEQ